MVFAVTIWRESAPNPPYVLAYGGFHPLSSSSSPTFEPPHVIHIPSDGVRSDHMEEAPPNPPYVLAYGGYLLPLSHPTFEPPDSYK